jgi:putative intracellular protease/amidase
VLPTRSLAEVDPGGVAVFILPGGDRWEAAPPEPELVRLLERLQENHIPIAAICGATVAVARAGLIRGRRHTSNGKAYLEQHAPGYGDGDHYIDAPAVRDRGLITASGLADVEFAAMLFDELGVMSESDRMLWTHLFRSGRLP